MQFFALQFLKARNPAAFHRGVEQWQLVGLITRRSGVRIPSPLPIYLMALPSRGGPFRFPVVPQRRVTLAAGSGFRRAPVRGTVSPAALARRHSGSAQMEQSSEPSRGAPAVSNSGRRRGAPGEPSSGCGNSGHRLPVRGACFVGPQRAVFRQWPRPGDTVSF